MSADGDVAVIQKACTHLWCGFRAAVCFLEEDSAVVEMILNSSIFLFTWWFGKHWNTGLIDQEKEHSIDIIPCNLTTSYSRLLTKQKYHRDSVSIPQRWRRLSLCSPFILVYFIREFKTGNRQTGMQSQKTSNSIHRFPSRPCTLLLFPTKITPLSILPHLHPYSTISLLSACLISTNPFLLGFIEAFITFHIKRTRSISPPFCNVAHLRRELAQFPISLLFFPDSHISMSLLGLSLPSQWIWSSKDQALERQRAPAAPTSPHPSLYPSLSPHPFFFSSLHDWPDLVTSWHYR